MIQTIIGISCTLLGAVIGYLTFYKGAKKDSKDEGKQSGTILTELGYIKSGIDEIKNEQREQRKINTDLITRVTAVEASTKQAHKRIDRIEGREHDE